METMKKDFKRRASDAQKTGDGGWMVFALFACGAFWAAIFFFFL